MKYGLIGEKLGHSYSKVIHELLGYYSYDLKEIPKDELDAYITSKDYLGLNVTIPYKQDVMKHLDYIDEGAKEIGAVNTIVNTDGKLSGYNTDFYGLKKLIESTGEDLSGSKVLILGTGGTSKTARAVVRSLGATNIIVVGRSAKEGSITYEEAYKDHTDADYIVNTTPAGMYPNIGVAAIDLSQFNKIRLVVDVVYNPARTQLMLDAKKLGIKSCGGLKMLVYQAVVAAEYFTGNKISEELAEKVYKTVRNQSENIVLIGMPSVGKTTIGKKLSKVLKMDFVDSDDEIVARENRQISDIFATDGEPYFRKVESEVIRDLSFRKNTIIATGGGAILNEKNVEVLKAFGVIYLLERDLDKLVPTGNRPLANNTEKLQKLYEERMPIYKKAADVTVNGNKGIGVTIDTIKRYRDEH